MPPAVQCRSVTILARSAGFTFVPFCNCGRMLGSSAAQAAQLSIGMRYEEGLKVLLAAKSLLHRGTHYTIG